ncbi:MAG: hypothetical protein U5L45_00870 [Saprospiraceae bacterium]|nr:hypothetical protein [Saprospiraceae bacterium]
MKKIMFSLVFAILSIAASFAGTTTNATTVNAPDSIVVKVKAGTTIYLELVNDFNTETAQIGNLIQLKVRSRVSVKGKTVIETNVVSLGRITEIYRSTANSSGSAKIEVRDVQAVDGQMINLNATYQLSPNCLPGQSCTVPSGFIITAHTMNSEEIEID